MAATVDLINVFNVASVFCVHEVSSSVTHPEMHGCFVVLRFRAVFTVRFVGGEMPCVMWSEFLMTSAISCPLWSSLYECQRVECAFTSPVRTESGMCVMYSMQCCMSVSAVL